MGMRAWYVFVRCVRVFVYVHVCRNACVRAYVFVRVCLCASERAVVCSCGCAVVRMTLCVHADTQMCGD